jgi:hypothetical protein
MLETKAVFRRKDAEIEAKDCVIDKVVRLSGAEFDNFSRNLMRNWDFIRDNPIDRVVDEQGRYHCLLVTGEGRRDGILVNSEGADYARYSAFFPNAQDLLAAERYIERENAEPGDAESAFAAWKNLTDRNIGQWQEDKRYRQHKDGALFYIGGEDGQYMRIAKDGKLAVGTYELAHPGIEDAVLLSRAARQYGSYEQAFLDAVRLAGQRFIADIFNEKPSVMEQIREARKAPSAPRKQKTDRGDKGREL